VEEDLQNMRHGLNEAESILDVDGGHESLLRGAQAGDLLLPKALRLYFRVTSSQSGQNRFRISVHGVRVFKNSVAVPDT
jgi:hypothetical protein